MNKYGAKDLELWGSCEAGVALANKLAPDGATILEMLSMKEVPNEYVHWIKDKVCFSDEDEKVYLDRMGILNSSHIYFCENITDSNNIIKSKNIVKGNRVFCSECITDSTDIVDSY